MPETRPETYAGAASPRPGSSARTGGLAQQGLPRLTPAARPMRTLFSTATTVLCDRLGAVALLGAKPRAGDRATSAAKNFIVDLTREAVLTKRRPLKKARVL